MNKANLNFKRVERYLPYLEEKGLIEHTSGEYKTTERGKEFLRDYQKMKEQLVLSKETKEGFDFFR
ncbi:MAG: winged helix-turn-helix domain-containing protein [Euryarchaeota archaeon]|nr:winged helix-turn-helix domain-containing protein [Euryarchaeota archaeon]